VFFVENKYHSVNLLCKMKLKGSIEHGCIFSLEYLAVT